MSVLVHAGVEDPDVAVCARNMCASIRTCNTYVPQPGMQRPSAESSTKSAVGSTTVAKKSAQAQGGGSTCRFYALQDFLQCVGGGEGERVDQPNTKANNNTVKTEVSAVLKK